MLSFLSRRLGVETATRARPLSENTILVRSPLLSLPTPQSHITTNSNIAQSLRQKLNSGYQIYNVFVNSCFAFPCLCFILFLGFLCVATLLVHQQIRLDAESSFYNIKVQNLLSCFKVFFFLCVKFSTLCCFSCSTIVVCSSRVVGFISNEIVVNYMAKLQVVDVLDRCLLSVLL